MPHARSVVIGASAGGFEAVRVLPVAEVGPQRVEWAMNGARRGPAKTHGDGGGTGGGRRPGPPAPPQLMAITCPSCGGSISEVREEGLAHYECHVGGRGAGIRRLIEGVASAPAARLVEAGDNRQSVDGKRGRRRGARRRPGGALAATREQARLSKEMHQASRPESRPRTNGRTAGRSG